MDQVELQPLPPATLRTSSCDDRATTPPPPAFISRPSSPNQLSLNPGLQLAPVDGGKDAWVFLAAATTVEVLVWGLPFSVGVLHSYWTTELFKDNHGAESTLTLAATLQTGLMYLSTVFFGPLLARFPRYRLPLQLFGLASAVAGIIGSGFATKPSHLLISLGLIYPVSCLLYLPCATLLFEWFSEKRGLGIAYAVVGVVAVLGIKPRLPIARAGAVHKKTRINWSFLKRSPIYSFILTILLTSLGNFVPTVWLASYASEVKSQPDGATLVAIMNSASVGGLIFTGWISDKVPTRVVIGLTAGGAALSSIFLWGFAGRSSALLVIFSLAFGATGLAFSALWSRLITIVSYDDPVTLPSLIFSSFAVTRGIGNIASGPIASSLLKSDLFQGGTGSYGLHRFGALLLFSGVMQVAGTICGVTYRHRKP